MKKAIFLPYACYQNEPSTPYPQIFDIPDNIVERDKMLSEFFLSNVYCNEDDEDCIVVIDESSPFGDIAVHNNGDDVWLFVTFLEEV